MKKKFNNEYTPKSSEDCYKFSKSVSYETLVAGTTTTGRGIKQTQKMFLGSADKPLTAVGTLTSLLCNSAKVVEKLLHRYSEPKAKNPKKTGIVIIGRDCEPIISAESKRDPRLIAMQSPRMTGKALSLSGASSEKQKESSLILRKAKFQAIFEFVLSSASGGAGGGKYNRISAFVSMPVLLIRRSLEKFFKKNFRDDSSFCFGFAKVPALSFLRLRGASGAQGISAPASCRKAHKRRFLFNSWILRFANAPFRMTIPVLALIFTLITTAELRADDVIPTSGTCNSAGTCLWSLGSDGTLTISAKDGANDVKMANYYCLHNPCDQSKLISRPWEASLQQIKSVVIGDNITHIGDDAFQNASNLTSVTGMKDVKTIGRDGVFAYTGLTSITIPDSVTSIGYGAFEGASSLTSITIPDSVTSIGEAAFNGASSLTNIMCKGDETSCAATVNALRARGYKGNISYPTDKTSCEGSDISLYVWDSGKCVRRNEEQCNSVAKYYYSDEKCQVLPKTKSACTGTNIEWNATDNKCVNKNYTPTGGDDIGDVSGDFNPADCYNNGQVPYNNQCVDEYPFAKKRWTPAEANEWLHDGNDNFVVITFKK